MEGNSDKINNQCIKYIQDIRDIQDTDSKFTIHDINKISRGIGLEHIRWNLSPLGCNELYWKVSLTIGNINEYVDIDGKPKTSFKELALIEEYIKFSEDIYLDISKAKMSCFKQLGFKFIDEINLNSNIKKPIDEVNNTCKDKQDVTEYNNQRIACDNNACEDEVTFNEESNISNENRMNYEKTTIILKGKPVFYNSSVCLKAMAHDVINDVDVLVIGYREDFNNRYNVSILELKNMDLKFNDNLQIEYIVKNYNGKKQYIMKKIIK